MSRLGLFCARILYTACAETPKTAGLKKLRNLWLKKSVENISILLIKYQNIIQSAIF